MLIIFFILGPIAVWVVFGAYGLTRLHRTEMERQAYLERIHRLTEENRALMEEADRLRKDMKYLESVIRERLRLVKPDEMVYRFGKEDTEEGETTKIPVYLMRRDRRLRPDITGTWHIHQSAFALYHHEPHMRRVEHQVWVDYGTIAPVWVGSYDGVPVIWVYQRP